MSFEYPPIVIASDILTPFQAIYRDIARTYPEHDMFKKKDGAGQESLFNVMKAYSVHDREVSYCHIVIECYEENIGRKTLITLKKG